MAPRQGPRKLLKSRPNPLDAAGITYIDYKNTDLLRNESWPQRSRTPARWRSCPTRAGEERLITPFCRTSESTQNAPLKGFA